MNTEQFEISYLKKLLQKSKLKRRAESPIIPIRDVTRQLAKLFCLNNYEISTWQYRFLLIWRNHDTHSYITSDTFMKALNLDDIHIIQLFFSIYSDHITAENIISFICVFCFMDIDNTIKILLSVCNINGNRAINPNQLHKFFYSINSTNEDKGKVPSELTINQPGEYTVPISMVVEIIRNNSVLNNVISHIKESLIKNLITYPDYYAIVHRQAYYNQISSGVSVLAPYEPCSNKYYRLFLTNKPSPYHTEYRQVTEEIDIENLTAQVVVEVRTLYGYSCRFSKVKKPSLSSTFSSRLRISNRSELQSPIPLMENTALNSSHRTPDSNSQNESHISFPNLYLSTRSHNINRRTSKTANFVSIPGSRANISKVIPM